MSRHGKIGRLPHALREQLNRRLLDSEPGDTLLAWLNALPEVKTMLRQQFATNPVISKQNLSDWRGGGFAAWQTRQEIIFTAQDLAADATDFKQAVPGRLSDHLATVLATHYAALLADWDGRLTEEFTKQLRSLRQLCRDITELRKSDLHAAKLELEERKLTAALRSTPGESSPVKPSQVIPEPSLDAAPPPAAPEPISTPIQICSRRGEEALIESENPTPAPAPIAPPEAVSIPASEPEPIPTADEPEPEPDLDPADPYADDIYAHPPTPKPEPYAHPLQKYYVCELPPPPCEEAGGPNAPYYLHYILTHFKHKLRPGMGQPAMSTTGNLIVG